MSYTTVRPTRTASYIGHALNKILKVANRSQSMLANANYVPGWDCHGLLIEWKIEEQYRKKGKDETVPVENSARNAGILPRDSTCSRNSSALVFSATAYYTTMAFE